MAADSILSDRRLSLLSLYCHNAKARQWQMGLSCGPMDWEGESAFLHVLSNQSDDVLLVSAFYLPRFSSSSVKHRGKSQGDYPSRARLWRSWVPWIVSRVINLVVVIHSFLCPLAFLSFPQRGCCPYHGWSTTIHIYTTAYRIPKNSTLVFDCELITISWCNVFVVAMRMHAISRIPIVGGSLKDLYNSQQESKTK